VPYKNVVIN